jgi:hypothetical protein
MTAIADAELQRLFTTASDMAGSNGTEERFIAALNSRLEAAERMYEGLRWMYGYYNAKCNGKEDLHAAFVAYDAAYRQSKGECT